MCKLQRLFTCIVVLLAASGCATSSVDKDYSLAEHPHDGIVVVSVSQDLDDVLGTTEAIFYWHDVRSEANKGRLDSREEKLPSIYKPSDFEDANGRLYAFNLPEGEYALTSWQIRAGQVGVYPIHDPQPLAFRVKAGQVKYVGNLHAHPKFGKTLIGLPALATGYPEIKDERARDLAVLQRRFPQFKDMVSVELLPLGPWINPADLSKVNQ